MLTVKQIAKNFGKTTALKEVSLQVHQGQILALAGESGCGKTTLLRIIAGLEQQDQGHILFDGQDISNVPAEKRNFGFVFQNLSLFPHLSVRKNIFFASPKARRSRARLEELLGMTGLSGLENRYPHELSGGQQQRVALARALATDPKMLLLDEPFSSLDEILKSRIRQEMVDLLRELKMTAILVSHQVTDVFLIADQLVILKEGQVLQQGDPAEVYQHPDSTYVADFLGASVRIKGKKENNDAQTPFGKLNIPNLPGDVDLLVRPEYIQVTTKHHYNLSGRIGNKQFKGPHDVLTICSEDNSASFSFETERCKLEVGDPIFMKVPEDKILVFT